ncbi:MAG: prepilin-type N-terminal cleavage/methylation domain-containing protein [Fuerstiella sp.]
MKRLSKTQYTTTDRSAFTLLELLAVIVIISILISLILPALSGAFRNANNAEVSAEFTQIDSAIQAFKQDFGGIEPWSAITLYESGTWDTQSKTRIRRLWPQFNFGLDRDINGDGDTSDSIDLTGAEALVFFLGGMHDPGNPSVLRGFSKNPVNPFQLTGDSRTAIYHEFDVDRLTDFDSDGFASYIDTIGEGDTPILYVSSNNGQGYSKADGSLNYYVQEDGTTPWNKSTFQLISPGADGEFGFAPSPTPFDTSGTTSDDRPRFGENTDVAREQADNLVNFNPSGTLGN